MLQVRPAQGLPDGSLAHGRLDAAAQQLVAARTGREDPEQLAGGPAGRGADCGRKWRHAWPGQRGRARPGRAVWQR